MTDMQSTRPLTPKMIEMLEQADLECPYVPNGSVRRGLQRRGLVHDRNSGGRPNHLTPKGRELAENLQETARRREEHRASRKAYVEKMRATKTVHVGPGGDLSKELQMLDSSEVRELLDAVTAEAERRLNAPQQQLPEYRIPENVHVVDELQAPVPPRHRVKLMQTVAGDIWDLASTATFWVGDRLMRAVAMDGDVGNRVDIFLKPARVRFDSSEARDFIAGRLRDGDVIEVDGVLYRLQPCSSFWGLASAAVLFRRLTAVG